MNGLARVRGASNEKVKEIIAYLRQMPEWDGKTYDEKLYRMLKELQADSKKPLDTGKS